MDQANTLISDFWRKEYSPGINEHVPYKASKQLQQMAALFTPGLSYYYVMNMHNLELDFISPSVMEVVGVSPGEATIEKLLSAAPPEEVAMLEKKESVIRDFFYRFLSPAQIPFYKLIYTYSIRTERGRSQNMLHQATALSVSENGKVQHVLSIHTDVTHLNVAKNHKLSFISLDGNESYLNMDVQQGVFDPELCSSATQNLSLILTCRELEIVKLLARGNSAKQIADILNLSFNTIRTHRKNMLQKTGCANTTEVVARCLAEGIM